MIIVYNKLLLLLIIIINNQSLFTINHKASIYPHLSLHLPAFKNNFPIFRQYHYFQMNFLPLFYIVFQDIQFVLSLSPNYITVSGHIRT